jgi:hypothetical protein
MTILSRKRFFSAAIRVSLRSNESLRLQLRALERPIRMHVAPISLLVYRREHQASSLILTLEPHSSKPHAAIDPGGLGR